MKDNRLCCNSDCDHIPKHVKNNLMQNIKYPMFYFSLQALQEYIKIRVEPEYSFKCYFTEQRIISWLLNLRLFSLKCLTRKSKLIYYVKQYYFC